MIITPKNWDSFQHYKNRSPAWIKLHRGLLDDFAFSRLPLASRALAPMLWLLASEYEDGAIDATLEELAFRFRVSDDDMRAALSPLVNSGFFIASEMIAQCKQTACLEREDIDREEKEVEESASAPKPKLEKVPRKKPKTQIPNGFNFSERVRSYGKTLGFSDADLNWQQTRFIRHAKENGRLCVEWDSASENWLDKALEFSGKSPPAAPSEVVDDGYIEVLGEDELTAWDNYARAKGAKSFPRNSRGGWRFPSRWPPGYVPPERARELPPTAALRPMQ